MGFRWFVCQAALRCGVSGDVCNLGDGAVEVRAQGPPAQLEALLAEVGTGPPGARVAHVESLEADGSLVFDGFQVRF